MPHLVNQKRLVHVNSEWFGCNVDSSCGSNSSLKKLVYKNEWFRGIMFGLDSYLFESSACSIIVFKYYSQPSGQAT